MDVSSFLGGNYLTHLDLAAPSQVWTVRDAKQELVGSDQKIVVYFNEHPKGLGLNKTNLRTIAGAYSTEAQQWIGKPIELYKDQTHFQGSSVPCIRVRIPHQPQAAVPAAPPAAQQVAPVAAPVQPVAPPQPPQQPQAATPPWDHAGQQNNPPAQG